LRPARLRLLLAVLALLAFAALPASPASAAPGETSVEAEFTYHEGPYGEKTGVRLRIWRDGQKVIDRPSGVPCPGCEVQPLPDGYEIKPVSVVQLDQTPESEVVFALIQPGAYCCSFTQIFRWDEALGRYLSTTHPFFETLPSLRDLRHDGLPVFVANNDRFANRFSCHICGTYPVQIWEYRSGHMLDVTASFPKQVKKDLAMNKRNYRRALGQFDIRAYLATIAADQCLLGHCDAGFAFARRAVKAGHVRPLEPRFAYGPYGRKFIPALRRFLRKLGYM